MSNPPRIPACRRSGPCNRSQTSGRRTCRSVSSHPERGNRCPYWAPPRTCCCRAPGVDDETYVEEAVLHLGMTGLGLGSDEYVVLARQPAQRFGLLARDVDGASARELDVVQIQHLVVKRLQGTFRDRDQADRKVEARQPCSRLDQVRQMIEVDLDVLPLADASTCWNEADCGVRADHP